VISVLTATRNAAFIKFISSEDLFKPRCRERDSAF
jgi:hypothetical protein